MNSISEFFLIINEFEICIFQGQMQHGPVCLLWRWTNQPKRSSYFHCCFFSIGQNVNFEF